MIKKWRNRFIIYLLITAFLAVVGFYLYKNIVDGNNKIAKLQSEGIVQTVEINRLKGVTYNDEGSFRWGYYLPISIDRKEDAFDGVTMTLYSLSEYETMEHKIEVYYMFDGDELITYDKKYVDNYKPWTPSQGILLWVLASVTFACAMYYVVRNGIFLYIVSKGEESIGRFEEAYHSSGRYYKVKYSFIRDGEAVTVSSPAIYDGSEVDKLKSYGSFMVRYKGKYSVIDQKL